MELSSQSVSAVKSRREEYSEATRRALLDSATELFASRGYARTSLDEVAVQARLTKGALYWHFDGKAALFRAVLEDQETGVVARITEAIADAPNAWEAGLTALRVFLDHCCDPVYGTIVMQEGPVALGYTEWRECEDKYMYGLTVGLLQSLVDEGLVQPLPVDASARVVFGMLGAAACAIAEATDGAQQQMRADMETVLVDLMRGRLIREP